MSEKLLSLCIPTNGVEEWVFPVLESIYSQNIDNSLFEVIVTDNGGNDRFKIRMIKYKEMHQNLVYKETNSYMFNNQLDALRLATGKYLKFVNHRTVLADGALEYLLDFVKENINDKPVVYFSNGVFGGKSLRCDSFNAFVANLGRFSSWTTGVGIWKDVYESIPENTPVDNISPHSYILFADRKKGCYIIDDKELCYEIDPDDTKKGTYDLYKAFAVEEFLITLKLYADGDIDAKTVKVVKKDYEAFLKELYWKYNILKKPCSYQVDRFDEALDIVFSRRKIVLGAYLLVFSKLLGKIRRLCSK